MEDCLSDINIYSILQRNPVNKLLINLKELLKRWLNSKYISIQTHNYINLILPRAYGLPKIHKKGFPLRIIVSSSGSPLHNLATYLQRILQDSLPIPFSHINNSFDLINKLNGLHIPENCILVSLDVYFGLFRSHCSPTSQLKCHGHLGRKMVFYRAIH